MATSPIEQFKVTTLGNEIVLNGLDISFSNAALFMCLSVLVIVLFLYFALRRVDTIPGKLQMCSEISYDFVGNIVKDNLSGSKGQLFIPLIYSIFMFLLVGNLLGLIPYSFAFTSQIIITLSLSLVVFCTTIVYGVYLHGFKVLKIFVPSGIPLWLGPFMFVLEFISFIAKAISVAVRLFANIMAGHILVEIITGFVVVMGVFGILPLSFSVMLYGFEVAICFIQAYIFAVLSCLFIDQVINVH